MPVYRGKDSKGSFYQWGRDRPGHHRWTRYYYRTRNERSRLRAKRAATRQGLAALASRNRR